MTQVPTANLTGIIVGIRERLVIDYCGDRSSIMSLPPSNGLMPPGESDWVMPLMSFTAGAAPAATPCAALKYHYLDVDEQDCGRAVLDILDRMPESPHDIQSSDAVCPPIRLLRLSAGKYIEGQTGHEDRYTTVFASLGKDRYPHSFSYVEYRAFAPLVMDALKQFHDAIAKLPVDGLNFRESLRAFEDA